MCPDDIMSRNLEQACFSRRGAWTCIIPRCNAQGRRADSSALVFRTVRSIAAPTDRGVFDMHLTAAGKPCVAQEVTDGALLRIEATEGTVDICMPTPDVTRLRGRGLTLTLHQRMGVYDHACPVSGGRLRVLSCSRGVAFLLTPLKGTLKLMSDYGPRPPPLGASATELAIEVVPDAHGEWDLAIEEWEGAWTGATGPADFDDALALVRGEFEAFCAAAPAPAGVPTALHRLGSYIFWSLEAEPRNAFKRPVWLVSKEGFEHVYSWDSAFTALGLWPTHPAQAWRCLMTVLEHQHPSGMISSPCMETGAACNFTNPPVHGWVLSRMRQVRELDPGQCAHLYPFLLSASNWWLNARDDDGDGLPSYFHGNDCGWDNATLFDPTPTVTSPDLAALLAVQFDELAHLARRLGLGPESDRHRAQAQRIIDALCERLWDGERFIALGHDGAHIAAAGDSLLLQHPILLGRRLPDAIRNKLIANLSDDGRFLCPAGLATESLRSPLMNPHGYWRGPVWPPPMVMLCHGLLDAGAEDVARTAAHRFVATVERSGYAENFNPLTGAPQCHKFLPWTVGVYRELVRVFGRG